MNTAKVPIEEHGRFLNWYLSNCFPREEYSRLASGLKTRRIQQIERMMV